MYIHICVFLCVFSNFENSNCTQFKTDTIQILENDEQVSWKRTITCTIFTFTISKKKKKGFFSHAQIYSKKKI